MSGSVLVRGARQLLTLRGPAEPRRGAALHELSIIRDGALLIEDGRIVEVGLSRRVENLASVRRSQEIDATGRVVMPGFVDCRAHLVWGVSALDDYEARIAAAIEEPPGGPAPDPRAAQLFGQPPGIARPPMRERHDPAWNNDSGGGVGLRLRRAKRVEDPAGASKVEWRTGGYSVHIFRPGI